MKKIGKLFFIFMMFLFVLPFVVKAEEDPVQISKIELLEKSINAEIVSEPTYSGLTVNYNIKLNVAGDYVKYKITIKNNDSEDYAIETENPFEKDDYIDYKVEGFDGEQIITANSTKAITITIAYKTEIPSTYTETKYVANNTYSVAVAKSKDVSTTTTSSASTTTTTEGSTTTTKREQAEPVSNPKTGIFEYALEVGIVLSLVAILIIIKLKKSDKFKTFIIIALLLALVPSIGLAITTITITVNTTVEIDRDVVKYKLTIDPNGGKYNNQTDKTVITLIDGKTYSDILIPEKTNSQFINWEVTSTSSTYDSSNNKVTINGSDITLKAKWLSESDAVAKIVETGEIFSTIQAAYNKAVNGQTVLLLKSTTEDTNNTKNISFDMDGYTQTGSLTNKGNLTIYDGTIISDDTAITNEGSLTLGFDDDDLNSKECVPGTDKGCMNITGKNYGLTTLSGELNFYDGWIKGKIGLVGAATSTPTTNLVDEDNVTLYYYPFVDDDTDTTTGYQYVYLSQGTNAVSKTTTNGIVYYYNLQDNIKVSSITKYLIYLVRNFDASYKLNIASDSEPIVIDLDGKTVNVGDTVTNEGTLTFTNSKATGQLNLAKTITNTGSLNFKNISVTGTSGENVIDNSKEFNMINSTLTDGTGYAVYIKGTSSTFNIDKNSKITSANYTKTIYIEKDAVLTIDSEGLIENTNSSTSYNYSYGVIDNVGTLTIKNINVKSNGVACVKNSNILTVDGGKYTTAQNGANYSISGYGGTTTINGGDLEDTLAGSSNVIMNGGTINSPSIAVKIFSGSTFTMNGGTIYGKNCGINYNSAYHVATITINSGAIIKSDEVGVNIDNFYFILNGGTIESEKYGIYEASYDCGNLKINSGTVKAKDIAINLENSSYYDSYIKSGTIESETSYGIYTKEFDLVIGTDDDSIDITSPLIKGETYGMYIEDADISLYDGIFKGITEGYYGEFSVLADGAYLYETSEIIDEKTYDVNYLKAYKDFLKINDTKYNSFKKAFNAIESTGTITVIEDADIAFGGTVDSGKTITINLNGHEITNTVSITNNGNLTFEDTSSGKTGKYTNIKNPIVNGSTSSSSLTLNEVTMNATNSSTISTYGTLTSNNSTINNESSKSGSYGISNYGTTIINGGTYESINGTSVRAMGNITAKNATIKGDGDGNGLEISGIDNGVYTLENLNITSANGMGLSYSSYYKYKGDLNLDNSVIISGGNCGLYVESGTVDINGANITSHNSSSSGQGIYLKKGTININDVNDNADIGMYSYYGTINMSGGTIIGTASYGLNFYEGFTNIIGGTIKSETSNGIYFHSGSTYYNLTIGSNDSDLSTTNPVIIGEDYGVYINDSSPGTIKYYDGVLKGKTNALYGSFNEILDGAEIFDTTDGDYDVKYLQEYENFLEVDGKEYNSYAKAVTAAGTSGTIKVLASVSPNYLFDVPEGKSITFDLNGYEIGLTNQLTVEGNLTITDTSTEQTGKLTNSTLTIMIVVSNTGSLTISGGTIEFTNDETSIEMIRSSGPVTMTGGKLSMPNSYVYYKYKSYIAYVYDNFTMTGGEIYSNNYGLYVTNELSISNATIKVDYGYGVQAGAIDITNSTIYASNVAVYTGGNITVESSNITSGGSYALQAGSSITVKSGTIKSNESSAIAGIYGDSEVDILGGTVEGKTYGITVTGNCVLNIGTKDGSISKTSPVIIGGTYGIYNNSDSDKIYFYDGIIKGTTNAINSGYTGLEDNSLIECGIETIDEETTYVTNSLTEAKIYLQSVKTGTKYKTLSDAIANYSQGDTIKLIDDSSDYYNLTVASEDTVLIDFNGHTLNLSGNITNNGTLYLTDSSGSRGTLNEKMLGDVIVNTGTLNIDSVNITTPSSYYSHYAINDSGTITISNSDITSYQGITSTGNATLNKVYLVASTGSAFTSTGTYKIENSNIVGYGIGIYSSSNNTSTIKNTTATVTITRTSQPYKYGALYIYSGDVETNGLVANHNIVVNSGSLKATSGQTSRIYNFATASFDGTSINSFIDNRGTLTLDNITTNISDSSYFLLNETNDTATATLENCNINLTGYARYGIDIETGKVYMKSGSLNISYSSYVYGVYINSSNAEFVMGEAEDKTSANYGKSTADVSTTNPSITATCTSDSTNCNAVYLNAGSFRFFDGIIKSSGTAIPQTITEVEYRYQVNTYKDDSGNEYRILEYLSA